MFLLPEGRPLSGGTGVLDVGGKKLTVSCDDSANNVKGAVNPGVSGWDKVGEGTVGEGAVGCDVDVGKLEELEWVSERSSPCSHRTLPLLYALSLRGIMGIEKEFG